MQFTGGDPQQRTRKIEARQAMIAYENALAEITGEGETSFSWTSKTAAQKSEALRQMVIVLARAVRFLMSR